MSAAKPTQSSPKFSLVPKILNGGIAGIVGVSVVFPLDLVKTRLQNQTVGPNGEKMYKNMLDCFKKTYAAEGYFGMYRGSAVNILLITPEKAIKLAANDMFRHYLTLSDGSLPIMRQMIAGGMAGACQIIVTTPMELLKIQMQDAGRIAAQAKAGLALCPQCHLMLGDDVIQDGGHAKPSRRTGFQVRLPPDHTYRRCFIEGRTVERITAMALTRRLLSERGIIGLYKGTTATAARDVTFSVIYFPLFATLNDLGAEKPGGPTPFWWSFISGCSAGTFASISVTPLDVIKTRMQTLTKGSGERQYTSILDCVTKILKFEGPTALFKGGACRAMVIAPLFGIAQAVYYIGIAEYILGLK